MDLSFFDERFALENLHSMVTDPLEGNLESGLGEYVVLLGLGLVGAGASGRGQDQGREFC